MTAAMRLLQQWDEEQTEFVLERADPSAPLGGLGRAQESAGGLLLHHAAPSNADPVARCDA